MVASTRNRMAVVLLALVIGSPIGCRQNADSSANRSAPDSSDDSVAQNAETSAGDAVDKSADREREKDKASDKANPVIAEQTPPGDPRLLARQSLDRINSEFDRAVADLNSRIEKLETVAEKQKLFEAENPEPDYTRKLLQLVQKYPQTDAAFEAGMSIILERQTSREFPRVMDLILQHHGSRVNWPKITSGYLELVPSRQIENWIRMMVKTAGSDEIRVRMQWLLYQYFDQFPTFASTIEYNPDVRKKFPPEQIDYIFQRKNEVRSEVLAALKSIRKEYPDVTLQNGKPVRDMLDGPIFELEHLQVGCVAPDIEGQDFDGETFRLSDYRGKIVMLDFWGNWCPPCRAMFPHERELIEKLVGKPFVLLGVNSDRKLETAIRATQQQNLVWRNFWCGPQGRQGAIARQWNVRAWPTVYLIDGKGVIRYKEVLGREIDRGIEALLAEQGFDVKLTGSKPIVRARAGSQALAASQFEIKSAVNDLSGR